ncbi:unnamed protein product [Sphenostylis stenocarpa]|uniref:Uncharacterized protein n=1 Tax=Sphenostylis stenocarpa TaxID=92480 RepID=A0AA86RY86_9FABA|nr:unnamed protein product [Sphenostylis stenocarpa]
MEVFPTTVVAHKGSKCYAGGSWRCDYYDACLVIFAKLLSLAMAERSSGIAARTGDDFQWWLAVLPGGRS